MLFLIFFIFELMLTIDKTNRKLSHKHSIQQEQSKQKTKSYIRFDDKRSVLFFSLIFISNDIPSPNGGDDTSGENNIKYHRLPKTTSTFVCKLF